MELEYCINCGNENPPEREKCQCGSRNFIFGNNFTFANKKVKCNCGNDKFEMIMHLNLSPIYEKHYKCTKCGNKIAIQTYCK